MFRYVVKLYLFAHAFKKLNNSGQIYSFIIYLVFWHRSISGIRLFTKVLCLASSRRSTKQRELPGTTSTTQTMWAASTSSARSPLACCTCWMRRASKNRSTWFFSTFLRLICRFCWSCPFISPLLPPFFCPLCLYISFPHATDETLLAKFKQQHQGNKYFVPTPVMEPAFVIQHFAGKVKYQVKVRTTDISKKVWILLERDLVVKFIMFLMHPTSSGLPGEEHRSHASRHCGVVEEQRPCVRAAAHRYGPRGHVSMGHPACHDQRTRCFQRSWPLLGCQDFRYVISFTLSELVEGFPSILVGRCWHIIDSSDVFKPIKRY